MASLTTAVIAGIQLALAATFVVVPVVGAVRGPSAQRAAEADLARQGHAASVLANHKVDFGATRASVAIALAIGTCFAAVAVLVLTGSTIGTTLTWIAQPIILLLGLVIMPGEVFTARYLTAAFRRSGDPATTGIDVTAFVDAARDAYPSWAPAVIAARFGLATAGSVVVLLLLVLT